ncbi:MAG: hypothetical protein QNK04_30500 [Myxococcota bacterium]|nr:hypothetical protein [Myxococcota bacterium]
MRATILGCGLVAVLLLGAGAAGAETLRDTMMLRAKDSGAGIVSIQGKIFHLTPDTRIVAYKPRSRGEPEELTLADLPVPETDGALVPEGEKGVLVKYQAEMVEGRRLLTHLLVYPRGPRAH